LEEIKDKSRDFCIENVRLYPRIQTSLKGKISPQEIYRLPIRRNTKMSKDQTNPSEDQYYILDQKEVILSDIEVSRYILDIGGGGEGIIGQLKGKQVIAIDPSKRELEEAAPGSLKLVMDARELQFLDNTFEAATSFFTLMYIPPADQKRFSKKYSGCLNQKGDS
jgi:hypothetical protein